MGNQKWYCIGTVIAYCAFICPNCMVGMSNYGYRHTCHPVDDKTRGLRGQLLIDFVRKEWSSVKEAIKLMSYMTAEERNNHFNPPRTGYFGDP